MRDGGYEEKVSTVASKTTELGHKTWGIVKDVMAMATLKVEEYTRDGNEDEDGDDDSHISHSSNHGNNGKYGETPWNPNNNAKNDGEDPKGERRWKINENDESRWNSNDSNNGGDCHCPTQKQRKGWDDWGPDTAVAGKSETKSEEGWVGWD